MEEEIITGTAFIQTEIRFNFLLNSIFRRSGFRNRLRSQSRCQVTQNKNDTLSTLRLLNRAEQATDHLAQYDNAGLS